MTCKRFHRLAVFATVALVGCNRVPANDPRMVSEWMHTLYGVVRAERVSPPIGSRLFAYASIALYSGLATGEPSMPPLAGAVNGFPVLPPREDGKMYDGTLVAVAAERVVMDSLLREGLPTTRATVRRLADSLERVRIASGSEETHARSLDMGRKIGYAIVLYAHGDGFDSTRGRTYVAPVGQGMWVNDSPGFTFAPQNLSGASTFVGLDNPANIRRSGNASDRELIMNRPKRLGSGTLPPVNMAGATEPFWGQLRPFVLKSWNECDAAVAPVYGTIPGTPLYDEAKVVYDINKHLTADQKATALFWADNPGESGTPTGHWLAIASQMVSEKQLTAAQAARLMTVTSLSLADAFITVWGYKFRMNLIRPRTYIRAVMDSTWEPAISTPPFPEYMSGHSALSAAAATAIAAQLGEVAFEDSTSIALGHPERKFASFRAAADEAGMSRIYGGIHFPSGNRVGGTVGRCIGGKVAERVKK
ncbi:MAG: hypothetical protein JWM95_5022 [Gemmatimonadetes bacterium]|nr:hypothetical protein [Gemmatimonadota bacterium]